MPVTERAGAGELYEIDAGPQPISSTRLPRHDDDGHDAAQIRHLLVAIAFQLFEKFRRADRRADDFDVVDVRRPVTLDVSQRGR